MPNRTLLTAIAALLLGATALAQDVRFEFRAITVQYDVDTPATLGEQISSGRMAIHGDQMRVEDDAGNVMLIRLSGDFAGFMFLDTGARKAYFLEQGLAQVTEETFTMAAVDGGPVGSTFPSALAPMLDGWVPLICLNNEPGACTVDVEVTQGGSTQVVTVAADIVQFHQTVGTGTLPGMMEDLPPEVKALMGNADGAGEPPFRVRSQTDTLGRYSDQLPGHEALWNFYLLLSSELGGVDFAAIGPLAATLSLGLAASASLGFPVVVQNWQETKIDVAPQLAMLGPMLEAISPLPIVSVSVLESVNVDPIEDPEALFYNGNPPDGYTLEVLSELLTQEVFGQ